MRRVGGGAPAPGRGPPRRGGGRGRGGRVRGAEADGPAVAAGPSARGALAHHRTAVGAGHRVHGAAPGPGGASLLRWGSGRRPVGRWGPGGRRCRSSVCTGRRFVRPCGSTVPPACSREGAYARPRGPRAGPCRPRPAHGAPPDPVREAPPVAAPRRRRPAAARDEAGPPPRGGPRRVPSPPADGRKGARARLTDAPGRAWPGARRAGPRRGARPGAVSSAGGSPWAAAAPGGRRTRASAPRRRR